MNRVAGTDVTVETVETVTRHEWEQVDDGPGGTGVRLTLSASLGGRRGAAVRGTVEWPGGIRQRLHISGWELTGPQELAEAWADRSRFALEQLRRRVAGEHHVPPGPGGRWDVTVRRRLRCTGADTVPSGLAAHHAFAPTQLFVDASTDGAGVVCLFGDGPVETDSARFGFAVGIDGTVAFDQVDPGARVPCWAQEPAREVTRMAVALREAADRQQAHGIAAQG